MPRLAGDVPQAIFLAATAVYLLYLWLATRASWLHPELLGTAVYIWAVPDESLLAQLRKVFDWKAFDPNVNRARPLNDLAETIDAIARPYITKLVGPHPSLTPSALITLIVSPLVLAALLRRIIGNLGPVLILLALFISSTAFLSVIVGYIRPAKKLTILLLILSMYFAHRHEEEGKSIDFWAFATALLLSFFSDEFALSGFVLSALLFHQSLFLRAPWWKRVVFFALPIVFLAITKWILPATYLRFGVHGAWDALGDAKKFAVFEHLLEPSFWHAAAIHTARSVLSSFGIQKHVLWTEISALAVVVLLPLTHLWLSRRRTIALALRERFVLATIAVFLSSAYATLLDWYPFPYEISYLGSFNYYYHSGLGVVIALWSGYGVRAYREILREKTFRNAASNAAIVLAIVATIANFILFERVNRLVQFIHTYPFLNETIFAQLSAVHSGRLVFLRNAAGEYVVPFREDRDAIREEFDTILTKVFGAAWQENDFFRLFGQFEKTPIWQPVYNDHALRAFFPHRNLRTQVDQAR